MRWVRRFIIQASSIYHTFHPPISSNALLYHPHSQFRHLQGLLFWPRSNTFNLWNIVMVDLKLNFIHCSQLQFSGRLGLRVAAIFIILATSLFGTLFPILTRRSKLIVLPTAVYEFAKYFGSGVIIATAFIHVRVSFFCLCCSSLFFFLFGRRSEFLIDKLM